jgi:hypothetical protein
MPFTKVTLKPGVNRENTRYTNEGGWYESDKVRFRQGSPEKIGGWTQYSTSTFLGVCRSLWNWVTLSNINLVGVGTNLKFYLTYGTQYFDITPIRSTVTLPSNPLATNTATNSGGKTTITVTTTNPHGALINDFVIISGATAVATVTVSGEYQITSVPTTTTFTILVTGTASSTTTGGGASATAAFQVNTGPAIQTPFSGWGAGTWGTGTWGSGSNIKISLQLWNQYNFGQNLIFGPRGGGIYYWDANTTVNSRGVALNYGGTVTITIASPAVITSSYALPNGSSVSFSTTGALPTGLVAGTTYYVVNTSGVTFNVAATQGGSPITTSGTQSGTQTLTLGDVPLFQNYLLVSDASRFTLVFGTNDYGGSTLDPMLIRWSDQENPFVWYPDITNQAGSVRLSHGSQIITAIQTRQEIFTLTDSSAYSLQYLGPPYVWGTQLLADNISIIGPNAAVLASGIVYWMGIDKFYKYDGRVQTLNCDLRRYVFNNISQYQNQQVYAGTIESFNEVWWFYCSANSNNIDRYVSFNYLENTWVYGTMVRTAWLDSGLQQYPIGAFYDPNVLTGSLLSHENGVDDLTTGTPAPIDAYISSSEFDIGDGDRFAFVDRILPDVTFDGSTSGTNPQTTMTLYSLNNSGSGYDQTYSNNVNYIASVPIEQFTGQVYLRARGRQMILKMESNKIGTTWQMGSPRFNIRSDGRR